MNNEVIEDATAKWNENIHIEKELKKFKYAEEDFITLYRTVNEYQ